MELIDPNITITELVVAYMRFANTHYVKNGKVTDEVACLKSAVEPLVGMFGTHAASAFGPLMLKAVRQQMVDSGRKCRTTINPHTNRIRRIFQWGVENQLIPVETWLSLKAVAHLKVGKTAARENKRREACDVAVYEAVRAEVKPVIRDIMDLIWRSAAQPCELLNLTSRQIDRSSSEQWIARIPGKHPKEILFGPTCREILSQYLLADLDVPIFRKKRSTVSNAMKRACERLGLPSITVMNLRHSAGDIIRASKGIDAAQRMLGHRTRLCTDKFTRPSIEAAIDAAADLG